MDIYTKSTENFTKNIEIFTKNYIKFLPIFFFYQRYWKKYQI